MTEHDEDDAPTVVMLPFIPGPNDLADVLERRRRIEDELRAGVAAAVQSVAETAAAVGVAGQALDQAVRHARAAGASWADIGRAVGITRQSAQARWADL